MDTVAGLLHVISAAVTPVVMISACATLMLAINSKHSNLAERIRLLAAELRGGTASKARQMQIRDETSILAHRYHYTYSSHVLLNCAAVVFIVMVPLIALTQHGIFRGAMPTLVLFMCGAALMLLAMVCEVIEISLSLRSIRIELQGVELASTRGPSGQV